ncbi:hypothetical protein PR048_015704 [Dryococelus australis]|uniref:Neurite outgrowth-associated protein n=1 Tax=Dryococelus australis TaxID=614101 RepID=A0ABQ9HHR3_9NEOP|nr:hypothetical protein PR048_015704 [Dryococelus australis]
MKDYSLNCIRIIIQNLFTDGQWHLFHRCTGKQLYCLHPPDFIFPWKVDESVRENQSWKLCLFVEIENGTTAREQRHEKESRHLKNIDRKYFKEKKNPNLLTWGEKEQIRYLHEMNREEWSVERLAASFPASNDIIKKVLNSTWKPENAARVLTHDEHVRKNWSLLTEGKLDINPDLKAHVSKFTPRRDLITSEAETTTAVAIPQKPRGKVPEFSNIIKQYKDLLEENGEIKNEICESFSSKEKYVPYNIESSLGAKKKHHFTLNEYRGNHTSKCELNEVQESNEPGNEVIQLEATSMLKFRPKNISVKKHASVMNQLKILNDDNIVDKIKIPKNKWQAGATYRVKDCYYDDDGRFLYRVPGMIHE